MVASWLCVSFKERLNEMVEEQRGCNWMIVVFL